MSTFLSDFGDKLVMTHYRGKSVMRHTHIHVQYELYLCLDPVEQVSVINGVAYTYRHPCAILSSPYTIHAMSSDDPDAADYDRYVFYFGDRILNSFSSERFPVERMGKDEGYFFRLNGEQAEYLKRLLVLCEDDPDGSPVAKEICFAWIVNKLFDFCTGKNLIRVEGVPFYIRDVLRYLSEENTGEIRFDEVARRFAVSRSKLDRDFKRFTGVTARRFGEICRFNHAKYLLEYHKELSVKEVAERCGFGSEATFFPLFKREAGMTPLEYRRTIKRDGNLL